MPGKHLSQLTWVPPAGWHAFFPLRLPMHRWSVKAATGGSDAQTMNFHYLLTLSPEVLLANAGYDATCWRSYILPRSQGGSLQDVHVKLLIEFFFPNLYEHCNRAQSAYEGAPLVDGDFASETNHRFLENLRNITFFWLQDAVILLQQLPSLKDTPPWSTLLASEPARVHLEKLADQAGYLEQTQMQFYTHVTIYQINRDIIVQQRPVFTCCPHVLHASCRSWWQFVHRALHNIENC